MTTNASTHKTSRLTNPLTRGLVFHLSKTLLAGALLLAPLATIQAQLITDSFLTGGSPNYTAADVVAGQNATVTGFTGAWGTAPLPSPPATATISATNLTFSNSSGSVASSGGSVFFPATQSAAPNAGRLDRDLTTAINVNSDTTVYMSLMIQNSLVSDTTQYRAFELNTAGGGDASRTLQLGLGNADFGTTNYGFRVNNNNSHRGNLGISNTETNFFVIKLTLSSTALSDSVTIWANPTNLGSETLSGAGVSVSGITLSNNIGQVQFSSFNVGGSTAYDELRIGDSWTAVTTIPEPGTLVMALVGLSAVVLFKKRHK